jgi:hypothetical protein
LPGIIDPALRLLDAERRHETVRAFQTTHPTLTVDVGLLPIARAFALASPLGDGSLICATSLALR